ncbi:M23 family metallopeptidase [Sinomonas terricola]|uniref:M23 family metallopeptidase n=1 Tax=Sinomonas terricola TaxID=3110330 RepID=UPI003D16BAF9
MQSSPFGYRVSPIGGAREFHRGQDFVAQCGSTVRASSAGTVTFAGWHPFGGGTRVVIDHGNGLETTYNHLSSFSVSVGQKVGRGDAVALSGTTGASTGCHLHFEVMVNGEVVDPVGWL